MATARSILKLWVGWPAKKSGVWSAGNGPAMRSGILGLVARGAEELKALVAASSRITHSDPRAERAAVLVALACRVGPAGFRREVAAVLPDIDGELSGILGKLFASIDAGRDTRSFWREIGIPAGVSGHACHTVPVALHALFRHSDDFRAALTEAITLSHPPSARCNAEYAIRVRGMN